MFGYVNIYKDELKIREYNTFRAYYCGLCKALKRHFSEGVRLGLSYDFTFLALVLSSVSGEKNEYLRKLCLPRFKRVPVACEEPALYYAAYMSVIVTYFKLVDDMRDHKRIKSVLAVLFYKRHLRKARRKFPEEFSFIESRLKALADCEAECCDDIDIAADHFAGLLERLFCPSFLDADENQRKALMSFGYHIGRFIYIADALDDMEEDLKRRNYNPILYHYKAWESEDRNALTKHIIKEQEFTVTLTLAAAAEAFELINFNKNRGIIENIVYLGLRSSQQRALRPDIEKKRKKRSIKHGSI